MRNFSLTSLFLSLLISLSLTAQAESKPITLGASLALSGKLAFLGVNEQRGFELALEDINRAGGIHGRPITLKIEDNQGEAKLAITTVTKLIELDKVDLLFTAFTHIGMAVKEITAQSGKFMLYHASSPEIAKAGDRIFRDYGDAEGAGMTIASSLLHRGFQKIGLLTENSDVCILDVNGMIRTLRSQNLDLVFKESYNPGETDLRPLLLKLKQQKIEALALCTWRDTSIVMRQLKELGMINIPTAHFHAPFLPASDTPEIRSLMEENHAVSSWYGFPKDEMNAGQQKFVDRYLAAYKEPPLLPDAAFAYDDLMLLARALAPCTTEMTLDTECLVKQVKETKHYGVAGEVSFSDRRLSYRPILMIKLLEGKWIRDGT